MNKKLFAVLCIAVLVLACASARVVNFAVGPSFGYFAGDAPLDKETHTTMPISGYGFGFDTTLSFTFGDRAELFFQDVFNISDKPAFPEDGIPDELFQSTLDNKSYIGFEYAVITDPVKLSVGAAAVIEMVMSVYEKQLLGGSYQVFPIIMNIGFGLTAKVEYVFAKNFSLFFKGNLDYYPYGAYMIGSNVDEETTEAVADSVKNFSAGASAGIVLFF
ncbi:MAG: hypothetical protein IKP61_10290 [Spirochaetales bacterium]|nr:hypothetical protein [Spirochaetales bacterium]